MNLSLGSISTQSARERRSLTRLRLTTDQSCKQLLSSKSLLAHLLQGTLSEFSGSSLPEIEKGLDIDDAYTDSPDILGLPTEDVSSHGTVVYDLRVFARPDADASAPLMVNIEAQGNSSPGYPLEKRAAYYCARMLSGQKDVTFTGTDYDHLLKVCSIWIETDPPQYRANTMETIFPGKTDRFPPKSCEQQIGAPYDLAQIVFLRLGDDEEAWHNQDNPCLSLFSILFSNRLTPPKKQELLQSIHHISIPNYNKEVLDNMFTYSQGVLNKGIRQGLQQGEINLASKLIQNNILTMEEFAELEGISLDELIERYNKNYNPITVVPNMSTYSQGVLNQGLQQGKIDLASQLIRDNLLTMEQAAQYAGLSLEEFTELYNEQIESTN